MNGRSGGKETLRGLIPAPANLISGGVTDLYYSMQITHAFVPIGVKKFIIECDGILESGAQLSPKSTSTTLLSD